METSGRVRPRGTIARALVFGALVGVAATAVFAGVGGAGSSSARAADTTAVTATAAQQDPDAKNAPFPDLAVTVSQTTELMSQGVTVSWTGGKKSTPPSGTNGGENFLQIAQCWGDDPANPGHPDRTSCQYGAFKTPGATRDGFVTDGTVAKQDEKYSLPRSGIFSPGYTSIPFTSYDGVTVSSIKDGKIDPDVDANVNDFIDPGQSNEVPWAGSGSDGTGSVRFEVQTALQASGLGCGLTSDTDPTVAPRSCWLVVIPRGEADSGEPHITQSGLRWDAWKHNIAFKLSFKPLGVSCNLGASERQLGGSELVAGAVASWQPVLCNSQGGAVYTMSNRPESDALEAANGTADAPLALTSRALTGGQDDLAYAPVAVGGLAISFAVDRAPSAGDGTPADQLEKTGLSFDSMKLTPRLLAKLLTSSYLDSLPTRADKKHLGANARNILLDPEFLDVNSDIPDWKFQAIVAPSVADLLVPLGRSDAAWQLWRYVIADPDAAAFLAGKADPWGMKVNPWASTDEGVNPTKKALTLPRDDFPKADPTAQAAGPSGEAEINSVTWRPYTNDLDQSAYLTLRGDGQVIGLWDPTANPPKYPKAARSLPGYQRVLGFTDTSSAAKYQVVTAALRNPAGAYVLPTTQSLSAAAAAMTPVAAQPQVVEYDPAGSAAKAAADAYPLAMPVYAATNPAQGDDATRADYAAFIRFAATTGQTPGVEPGQLPPGYAPIPAAWKAQAIAAAAAIQSGATLDSPTDDLGGGETVTIDTGGYGGASSIGAAVDPAPVSADPQALGDAAGSLSDGKTAKDPNTGALAAILPGGLIGGVAAAGALPVIARLRRFP